MKQDLEIKTTTNNRILLENEEKEKKNKKFQNLNNEIIEEIWQVMKQNNAMCHQNFDTMKENNNKITKKFQTRQRNGVKLKLITRKLSIIRTQLNSLMIRSRKSRYYKLKTIILKLITRNLKKKKNLKLEMLNFILKLKNFKL